MILAWAVILGLLASLVRYRTRVVEHLAAIHLHWAWLVLLAVALQLPLLRTPLGPRQQVGLQQVVFLVSYLLLLLFVWRNRHATGIQIAGLGVVCNLLVIAANGGLMPITPKTLVQINPGSTLPQWPLGFHYGHSKDVILLQQQTNLWALSDVLVIPSPFPWPTAFSPGDLLIAAGIFVLLFMPRASPDSTTPRASGS